MKKILDHAIEFYEAAAQWCNENPTARYLEIAQEEIFNSLGLIFAQRQDNEKGRCNFAKC